LSIETLLVYADILRRLMQGKLLCFLQHNRSGASSCARNGIRKWRRSNLFRAG